MDDFDSDIKKGFTRGHVIPDKQQKILGLILQLTDLSQGTVNNTKIISDGLAETMRQVIDLKARVEKLEGKLEGELKIKEREAKKID